MWIAKLIRSSLRDLDVDLRRVRAKTLTATADKTPSRAEESFRVFKGKQVTGESITSASRNDR